MPNIDYMYGKPSQISCIKKIYEFSIEKSEHNRRAIKYPHIKNNINNQSKIALTQCTFWLHCTHCVIGASASELKKILFLQTPKWCTLMKFTVNEFRFFDKLPKCKGGFRFVLLSLSVLPIFIINKRGECTAKYTGVFQQSQSASASNR